MTKLFLSFLIMVSVGCSSKYNSVFEKTDAFVSFLNTSVQSYGLIGAGESTTTSDGQYKITPIGRLVNVKIEKEVSADEYEKLRSSLEKHYKGNPQVNKVYISNGGTVMIDCRS